MFNPAFNVRALAACRRSEDESGVQPRHPVPGSSGARSAAWMTTVDVRLTPGSGPRADLPAGPRWVRLGKSQAEHIRSASLPETDVERTAAYRGSIPLLHQPS